MTDTPTLDAARRTLGVTPTASADDLRRAYRRQALALHPDRNPRADAAEAFRAARAAYEALVAAAAEESDAEAAARVVAEAETAARAAAARRRRAARVGATWQAIRVPLAVPPPSALARATAWLRRTEPETGEAAVEALADGLRDLRWTVTVAWDEIAGVEVGPDALELVLTDGAAARLAGRVPEGALAMRADGRAGYRLPLAEPARLAALVEQRAARA